MQFGGGPEAIVTGSIAGHNSVRLSKGIPLLEIPVNLAIGDLIAHEHEKRKTEDGLRTRYTFAGSHYFKSMKDLGLYTIDGIIKMVMHMQINRLFEIIMMLNKETLVLALRIYE